MTDAKQRVLLLGATGYIGRDVLRALLRSGREVLAVARTPGAPVAGCDWRTADLTDPEAFRAAVSGDRFDAVVSCIASRNGVAADAWQVDYAVNRTALALAIAAGARRYLLLSAICVQRPRLEFQRAKLAFEKELAAAGIDYTVVRPTAFFKSLSGQVRRVRQGKPYLMFGDGNGTACKPISARDLASYIVHALDDPAARNRVLPIGGPGPALTPRQQGAMLFALAGLPPTFRSVPVGLFTFAERLLAPLQGLSRRVAAKVELARIGRYYATESMLVWDDERQCYDANATPETGEDRLEDHYKQLLAADDGQEELGEHRIF